MLQSFLGNIFKMSFFALERDGAITAEAAEVVLTRARDCRTSEIKKAEETGCTKWNFERETCGS